MLLHSAVCDAVHCMARHDHPAVQAALMKQCERLAESKEGYDVLIQSLENQVSFAQIALLSVNETNITL